jgi:hypothetical protein
MGLNNLKLEASNLDELIEMKLSPLRGGGAIQAKAVMLLCSYQRQRACASLLLKLDGADFCRRLVKSALAYLFLLENRTKLQVPDPYLLARSKGTPILDAIAATDWSLAVEIAAKSTPQWTVDMEDEDDFWYFATLGTMVGPGGASSAADPMARLIASGGAARAKVLESILNRKQDAFETALADVLSSWEKQANKARASPTASPYFANIETNICVEGLALVQLARKIGLPTAESYPFLPKHALEITPPSTRPTIWEDLC